MQITDFNGDIIVITDLSAAIKQAKEFMEYIHNDTSLRALDEPRRCYWTDMYNKLTSANRIIHQKNEP